MHIATACTPPEGAGVNKVTILLYLFMSPEPKITFIITRNIWQRVSQQFVQINSFKAKFGYEEKIKYAAKAL